MCNGKQNKKVGFGKDTPWYEYVSSARTFYRMMWFMQFLELLFGNIVENKEDEFKVCASKAYDIALGVHHGWVVKTGAKTGLKMAPKRAFVLENVFKEFPDWTEE